MRNWKVAYEESLKHLQIVGGNLTKAEAKNAELEQVSGSMCDKCGFAMKFPDEPCRCELEAALDLANRTHKLTMKDLSLAEQIEELADMAVQRESEIERLKSLIECVLPRA
jgi:hypothetical protein